MGEVIDFNAYKQIRDIADNPQDFVRMLEVAMETQSGPILRLDDGSTWLMSEIPEDDEDYARMGESDVTIEGPGWMLTKPEDGEDEGFHLKIFTIAREGDE